MGTTHTQTTLHIPEQNTLQMADQSSYYTHMHMHHTHMHHTYVHMSNKHMCHTRTNMHRMHTASDTYITDRTHIHTHTYTHCM